MEAQSNVRVRMAPMVALTGAVVIATAATVSAAPVQRAAENAVPAVVHQVKSLPVQLTAYNPFAPYAQPVGVIGYALTTVFATQTAVALPIFDGATETLTAAGLDPRWAEQPQLIARSLVLPLAVAAQTALVGALEGTYIYGKFTPAEALNFFIDAVKTAINGFIAAERALFGQQTATARVAEETTSVPEASSTELLDTASVVALSTAQPAGPAATEAKSNTSDAEIAGETAAAETTEAVTEAVRPAFTLPALRLPTLKLATPKFPAPKKARTGVTSVASASNPQADNDRAAASPKPSDSESSDRDGDAGGPAS